MSATDFNTISLDGLKEILKVAKDRQDKDTVDKLHTLRKNSWDIYNKKELPKEQRLAAAEKIVLLHNYFGMKDVSWIVMSLQGGGPGKRIVTKEMRDENCTNFIKFLADNGINPNNESLAMALAHVWGEP